MRILFHRWSILATIVFISPHAIMYIRWPLLLWQAVWMYACTLGIILGVVSQQQNQIWRYSLLSGRLTLAWSTTTHLPASEMQLIAKVSLTAQWSIIGRQLLPRAIYIWLIFPFVSSTSRHFTLTKDIDSSNSRIRRDSRG